MSLERVDDAAQLIAASTFCPPHFRDKQTGQPRLGDLRYAVAVLDRLDVDPLRNIDQTYVAGGRVTFMAELQRVFARRAGYDLWLDPSSDEHAATVCITKLFDGPTRAVTVTMAEATRAKWPERNPSYGLMPDRMLAARACTRAISMYAPEASRLIETSAPPTPAGDAQDGPPAHDNTIVVAPSAGGPAKPSDQASPKDRAALHRALARLTAQQRQYVYDEAKDANMPNLDGARFTNGHALGLYVLIGDALDHPFGPTTEQIDQALADATPVDDPVT